MGRDDRTGAALLAGVTVAALAVGGWWWREAAPRLGPVSPSPSPTRIDRGVKLVDPSTGQVLREVQLDPEEPAVLGQESDDAPVRPAETLELWHEVAHLVPGLPLARQSSPSADATYALSVRCSGRGAVVVEFSGVQYEMAPQNVRCEQGSQTFVVQAGDGRVLVRLSAVDGEVDLDARLSQLS